MVQKDSRSNLSVAEAAKDDSSAMRNLTLMSIFLPGTFVSALISMSMFDWQAESGKYVVSSRFWIYWAITVPITITLLMVWWMWMRRELGQDRHRLGQGAVSGRLNRASTMKVLTQLQRRKPAKADV